MQKLLIILLGIAANLCVIWFANKSGKISEVGSLFGWHYDSKLISSTIVTLKFFWILLIVNVMFSYASKTGIEAFESSLTFILVWMAMAPLSALIYNFFINKEPVNWVHFAGLILVFSGTIMIYANKEILKMLK